jgi:hypothetical protein
MRMPSKSASVSAIDSADPKVSDSFGITDLISIFVAPRSRGQRAFPDNPGKDKFSLAEDDASYIHVTFGHLVVFSHLQKMPAAILKAITVVSSF